MAGDWETLPCGCRIGTVNDTFAIEPCAADCRWLQYVLDESERQGMPTTMVADPQAEPEAVNAVEALVRQALGGDE